MNLKESLKTINDIRIDICKKHSLVDILMIVFLGYWEVIGGNLEFGKDFTGCVTREVKEEIICNIKNLTHLHSRTMYLNDLMYITVAYYGEILEEPVFNKKEISEIKWITENEIDDFEFCPGDVELLKIGFKSIK